MSLNTIKDVCKLGDSSDGRCIVCSNTYSHTVAHIEMLLEKADLQALGANRNGVVIKVYNTSSTKGMMGIEFVADFEVAKALGFKVIENTPHTFN